MLDVSHVTKKYGKVTACNDVSLHLDPGSVTRESMLLSAVPTAQAAT